MTPIEAVIHDDPYPYYSALRQQGGFEYDMDIRLWIASSARAVEVVLASPYCSVRPLSEPVPNAISRSAAGAVFGQLMRMNEGASHTCPKMAIESALTTFNMGLVNETVSRVFDTFHEADESVDELMFTLPVSVVAALIGFRPDALREIAELTRDFVACLSPLSNDAQLIDASDGASRLSQSFTKLLGSAGEQSPLLSQIVRNWTALSAHHAEALVPNLIGLLSQTCEATAGLIGNSVIALQRRPDLLHGTQPTIEMVIELVAEVARFDAPVQNTRRFVTRRCVIEKMILEPGDAILVLLASANRDPEANSDPDSFLLERASRKTYTFGAGRHGCPGQQLALAIASSALHRWLRQAKTSFPTEWAYLPSLNGRIPRFHSGRSISR